MADSIPSAPYPKPPIVEGVFGFHFAKPVERRALDRFVKMAGKGFPAKEDLFDFSIVVSERKGRTNVSPVGYKIRNADKALVLVLRPETVSVIRTAPYTSWYELMACTQDVWGRLKKVAGHPALSRLSTRFINRIDIKQPAADADREPAINVGTYLRPGIVLPQDLTSCQVEGFQMAATLQGPGRFTTILQVKTEPSPLIDHVALVLDIDVATNEDVPSRDDAMWALAEGLHEAKNLVFEACITDASRRLFA